jgi:uncharacterized protein (TIGR02145 family)
MKRIKDKQRQDRKRMLTGQGYGNILAFALAVLVALCGCDETDGPVGGGEVGDGRAKVRFSIGGINYGDEVETRGGGRTGEPETVLVPLGDGDNLLECTLTREPQTRAGAQISMAEGTAVRVFVYEGGIHVKDSIIRVGSTTDAIVLDAGKTYTIRAVSYNLQNGGGDIATVAGHPALSGSALNGISPGHDLLYAEAELTTIPGVNNKVLIFDHKFSRIKVTANSTQMSANIEACTATLTPGKTASLSLNTGTPAPTSPDVTQSLTWPTLGATTATSKDTAVYTGDAATLTLGFNIRVGSTDYTKSVDFSGPLNPGKRYTVTVNFKHGIPGAVIGDLTWAKANLYETTPSGTYALFTNEWEYGSGMAGGGYWNWGAVHPRSDYQSYSTGDGTASGTLANTTYWAKTPITATTDPCRAALGGTWRLPTAADFNSLFTYSYPGTYSGSNPAKGRWFTATDIGLTQAQSHPALHVFLPYAGYKGHNEISIYGATEYGRYWSRDYNSAESVAFASVRDDRAFMNVQVGYWGHSVRCVR